MKRKDDEGLWWWEDPRAQGCLPVLALALGVLAVIVGLVL